MFPKQSTRLILYGDEPSKVTTANNKYPSEQLQQSAPGSLPDDSLRALEVLVICSICQNRLRSPRMLQCQHTFCLACLEAMVQQHEQKNYITCSTCNEKHELMSASGRVTDLPPNLYIDSVLQVLSRGQTLSNQNMPSTAAVAAAIEKEEVHLSCYKCATIGNIRMQNCGHCKQTLCAICWQTHMGELAKQVQQLNVQLNSASEKMDRKMTDYKVRFSDINLRIKEHYEEKIAKLRQYEQNLLGESRRVMNDAVCAHELVMEKIRHLKTSIEGSNNGAVDTHDNFVDLFLSFHKEVSIVFEEISQWGKEIILFDQENSKIEVINTIADGTSSNTASTIEGTSKVISSKCAPLNTRESITAFYKNHSFKPKMVWNKCHRPAGVGMAPWMYGETNEAPIYIAGAESKMLFVVNKTNGDVMQRVSYDKMVYPNAITFDQKSKEVFVSDKWKHCIFVFSAEGTFLRQLCEKGDQEGRLRAPEGLATGPSGTLFVCDTGNDRVQCISSTTGRMLSQFGRIQKEQLLKASQTKTPTRHVDLKCPTDVAIYNDTVIVLDSGNRRVKIFNKRGEQIREFGQIGSLPGQFQYPEVMAVDPSGFILVGDGGNARILVYQPSGQFVTAMGSRGDSPGKFNWLTGLFVGKDREIIISDNKNHTVQVFC
uniref:RING-type domain-containing protein n=1 Tax=Culex quinquefasciatus TaxID=7176 RepID=A0A904MUR9_CULQU